MQYFFCKCYSGVVSVIVGRVLTMSSSGLRLHAVVLPLGSKDQRIFGKREVLHRGELAFVSRMTHQMRKMMSAESASDGSCGSESRQQERGGRAASAVRRRSSGVDRPVSAVRRSLL